MNTKEELNLLLETTKSRLEIEKEMKKMTKSTLIAGISCLIAICLLNFKDLNAIDIICISTVCFSIQTQVMDLINSNRVIRILESKITHIENVLDIA